MKPHIKQQVPIAFGIYMGQLLLGYSMAWTAPVVEKLKSEDQTTLPAPITDTQVSWVGSMLYAGSLLGPHVFGYFSNVIGRKPCLIFGGTSILAAFVMVIFTSNIGTIYALRAVKGLGTSITLVAHLVYLGEISSTEIRGILLTCTGIFSSIGAIIAYSVGPYVSYEATGYVGVALSLIYLIGLCLIPESPIYHVIKGNDDKAQKILNNLGRADETELIKVTKISVEESQKIKYRWVQLFSQRSNRKALFIIIILIVAQQLSGVIVIQFYLTTIFEIAGSSVRSDIASIIYAVVQLIVCCFTPFFVERSGRRPLLLVSTAASAISLGVLAIYFYLDHIGHEIVGSIGWLPLVTLVLFVVSYTGLGSVPFTLIGEMFNINVRSTGSSIVSMIGGLCGFILTSTFAYVIAYGGHYVFGFFSLCCLLTFVFSVVFVPETKGKSLAEIEDMLGR